MAAKEVFGLIVRVTGFGFVIMSVFDFIHAVGMMIGLPIVARYSVGADATAGVLYLVFGVVLIATAESITRLVYGRDHGRSA